MAPNSPVVARWELSYRTRKRRDEMGITGPQIAKALKFSPTYWPKVERDQRILSEDKLIQLLKFLDFTDDEQAELVDLRQLARQNGWWSQYDGLFSEQQSRLYGLEHGAEEISMVEPLLIPGILQTEEYAYKLHSADGTIRKIEVQQRVDARMERQKRLDSDEPLRLRVVVSEAVLHQQTGGRDVLQNQLRHLVTTIERLESTLSFRVLPFTSHAGAIRAYAPFLIFYFSRPALPTLAWSETPAYGELIEDQERMRSLKAVFGQLQAESLDQDESLNFIKQLVD